MCVHVCEWVLGWWFVCLVLLFIVGQWCLTLPWVRFTGGAYGQDRAECYHSKPLQIGPRCVCVCVFKAPQVFPTGNQGGESGTLVEILKLSIHFKAHFINKCVWSLISCSDMHQLSKLMRSVFSCVTGWVWRRWVVFQLCSWEAYDFRKVQKG